MVRFETDILYRPVRRDEGIFSLFDGFLIYGPEEVCQVGNYGFRFGFLSDVHDFDMKQLNCSDIRTVLTVVS